ncbi:hypothetical protein ACFLZJ_01795 [Nanoarchaeota archaeon]
MNRWAKILIGLVLLVAVILIAWASSAYAWTLFGKDFNFMHSAWVLLKGGIFWILILVALLLIMLGISDLKD